MKEKPRILMIGPDRHAKGGISSVVNLYYEKGLQKGIELKYITTAADGEKMAKIAAFIKGMLTFWLNVSTFDIVHIHMASRNSYRRKRIFVAISKKYFRKRVILHLHGAEFKKFYMDESDERQKLGIKKTFLMADKVIALSKEWADFLENNISGINITVIPNAVSIKGQRNSYEDKNILFLGRVGQRKGIYDLLESLREIVSMQPSVHLYIGGDGEVEKAKQKCREMGLQNNVSFCGWVSGKEREKLFMKSSIFVLPSYNEGLPMAMLEAMSYGMAVIASNVGGYQRLLQTAKTDC